MTVNDEEHANSVYQQACRYLSDLDTDWSLIIERVGPCGLVPKLTDEPYETLIRAIAHQQLHGRAAEAILKRFLALFPEGEFPEPQQILSIESDVIRKCGFSMRKINTIKAIAEACLNGRVPNFAKAKELSNDVLIRELTVLPGIGPWTVEMLLIFNLGRLDVLPVHDFGIREGYKRMKSLDKQPTPKELAKLGESWSPYRSIASWYLWRA
ncbi:MAG: DNA-3-methyladenine glycosylase [Legionella sp.]|uniref:DNA-3-methyladenine glycosylase family protein n=1 Tax=Legionella sp. TaxID=459 RepID=UPI0028425134|nr:DNA-3-methyladenine glycosylase [Legionella sp.]